MPATDPISKTVACQFGIDPVDFGFEVGSNLNPPTEPGVGNLIKLVIDAILATFVFFSDTSKLYFRRKNSRSSGLDLYCNVRSRTIRH